jgi:formylglycine-generating enzyme required for sulfatase activity
MQRALHDILSEEEQTEALAPLRRKRAELQAALARLGSSLYAFSGEKDDVIALNGEMPAMDHDVMSEVPGLSPSLYARLRAKLLQCGPFDDVAALADVFIDARISRWRDCLPDTARDRRERVKAVIKRFYGMEQDRAEDNALVLLLRVLADCVEPGDACHRALTELAFELEGEIRRHKKKLRRGIQGPSLALAHYLNYVIEVNRRLRLQGIRAAGRLVSLELEHIYITLMTTIRRTSTDEDAWIDDADKVHLLVDRAPGEMKQLNRHRIADPYVKVSVHEALAEHPRLVVLGDPGSGKTTLLRYLALTYARDLAYFPPSHGEMEGESLVKQRLRLNEHRLPILLPLRDFARYLETHYPDPSTDGPKLLRGYLRTYFTHQDIALPERFFAERLERGVCVMLLDGVDEVPSAAIRQRVVRLIERFTLAYPDNRYVITSRIVGYTGGARLGADYMVTTVRDFTQEDIARFVMHWNHAVEVALAGGETPYALQQARSQTQTLLEAIEKNARVHELAVNPLLLTVITLVQRYRAQLPERRTELYEEAMEVLLGKWDEAKGLLPTMHLQGIALDAGDRRSLLEPVALWMMEQRAREIDAEVLQGQLSQRFCDMLRDERQAEKAMCHFLQLIDERSGLLNERGQGVYAFSHLTFQEYLAARAVADRLDYIAYTLDRLGDSWWREVILLEVGYLSTQGKRRTTALIRAIMDCEEEPELYHNLVLAAQALRDVGPARVEGDLWEEVQLRLRKEFETPLRASVSLSHTKRVRFIQRRAAAAEAWARIESGQPVTQPAFWMMPYGEPVWVEIPAGEFWMGSERGAEDEKPLHRVRVARFWIARVPVTNAQYQLFVEATGHKAPDHWEGDRVPRGLESHPVVYVSWHDVLAYCRWLSEVTGELIMLPGEAQWEKAARGDQDQRAYPWGDVWDDSEAQYAGNTRELGLGLTTPVGIFPDGASPYGCLDMAGNVWGWTRSLWGVNWRAPDFRYPYDAGDGREDLGVGSDVYRVLRGGAFQLDRRFARCSYRDWDNPYSADGLCGFRVIRLAKDQSHLKVDGWSPNGV